MKHVTDFQDTSRPVNANRAIYKNQEALLSELEQQIIFITKAMRDSAGLSPILNRLMDEYEALAEPKLSETEQRALNFRAKFGIAA